jgi:L-ascorbate metabolism protein UlaG (beta-lactamase superfamily)
MTTPPQLRNAARGPSGGAATVTLRHVGGPTALIAYGRLRILTDPTFDPPGDYPRPGTPVTLHKLSGPAFQPDDLQPIDVVLVSHDHHSDNLDVSGRELVASVPVVLTTAPGAVRLGCAARGLQPGESVDLDAGLVRITAVRAEHGPPEVAERNGPVIGFVLSAAGLPTVYVSVDNASLDVVSEVRAAHGPIQAAVLFAGGAQVPEAWGDNVLLTLDAHGAARAATLLPEAIVVAIHQEGWAHFSSPPGALKAAFSEAGLSDRLQLPLPGDGVAIIPRQS